MRARSRAFILLFAVAAATLLGAPTSAIATTYVYQGLPMTQQWPPPFGSNDRSGITMIGSVTFSADTSTFTGTLSLSDAVAAALSTTNGYNASFEYPYEVPPVGAPVSIAQSLAGSFTLLDGEIVSWDVTGREHVANCGAGAGCSVGLFAETTSTHDLFSRNYLSPSLSFIVANEGGGAWRMIAGAVPEPSTWAMLLIGFAG